MSILNSMPFYNKMTLKANFKVYSNTYRKHMCNTYGRMTMKTTYYFKQF